MRSVITTGLDNFEFQIVKRLLSSFLFGSVLESRSAMPMSDPETQKKADPRNLW